MLATKTLFKTCACQARALGSFSGQPIEHVARHARDHASLGPPCPRRASTRAGGLDLLGGNVGSRQLTRPIMTLNSSGAPSTTQLKKAAPLVNTQGRVYYNHAWEPSLVAQREFAAGVRETRAGGSAGAPATGKAATATASFAARVYNGRRWVDALPLC